MYRSIKLIFLFLLVFCFSSIGYAQETTGILEITTKDSSGAVVPGVTVTVTNTGNTAGFRRTVTTDGQGFQRILQVPPGVYKISSEATSGFSSKVLENITIVLGKATPVSLELGAGGVGAVVDVNLNDVSPIDVSDSKIQTNINAQTAELLPKGTNFGSVLKVSPATRPESKTGGYQIDGASGSENTFIIDGNEVTNPISGTLDSNNNLPFELVQEVQIKSSGFQAEYGGATGGVINVVTKGGNNDFHATAGINVSPSKLQAARRDVLYLDDATPVYFGYRGLDSVTGFFPSLTLSGPVIKDRVWFIGSFNPQIVESTRTIPYRTLAPLTYRSKERSDYGFGRIDAQPFTTLRVSSSFVWTPYSETGQLPALTSQVNNIYPSGNGLTGTAYQDQLGGRQNGNVATVQGVWTPTGNFVLSARYGRNFLNQKLGSYGLPTPYPYSISNSRYVCHTSGLTPPPGAGCVRGGNNGVGWTANTLYDATVRQTVDVDGTFLFSAAGRHEFKGGYQLNKIFNDVLAPRNAALEIYYGKGIDEVSGRNVTPTVGAIGAARWRRYGDQGQAGSDNTGIYIQDKWQPISRLTLNLGIRFEKEDVPSFNEFDGIKFGWGDKIAPRIGGAFDLTGDGKTKVSAFFGWFYDRFKYELPRGSFGGAIYYSDWFEVFDPNKPFNSYDPTEALTANAPIIVGGSCPQTGFAFGGIRCSVDHRVPSNDPSLDIAEQGGIDPDMKAYRQTEYTITFERELSSKYVLSARYTRKKLDRAIEDAGFITPSGSEAYIIGNPGMGLIKKFYEDQGYTPVKARRDYDAVEIALNRRFADNYYFNLNYTWSRLYGNYGGLASSDENGRTDPNVSRAFDAPFTEATVAGGETLGLLATDRPHVVKFAGAYSFDWNKRFGFSNNATEFQTFFTAQSGTPLTTYVDVAGYDNIILNKRGDLGRTDFYTQTDFAVRHRYKFGNDSRFTFVAEIDLINLFNQKATTNVFNLLDTNNYALDDPANGLVTQAELDNPNFNAYAVAQGRFQKNGAPKIAAQVNGNTNDSRDPRFGLANAFQGPRTVRFGFRFIF